MNVYDFISDQFDQSGMKPLDIKVLRYSAESFGDFVANVRTDIGVLRVERERGQSFVDYLDDESGAFIRGDIKWPQLLPIFNKGKWELCDLLKIIAHTSTGPKRGGGS